MEQSRTCALEGCVNLLAPTKRPNARYCSTACKRKAKYWRDPERWRTKTREWYQEHPEQAQATSARWRAEHPDARYPNKVPWRPTTEEERERVRAQKRAAYARDLEASRAVSRDYAAKNREAAKIRARDWIKNNPARHQDNMAKRRARELGAHVETVERAIVFARAAGICGICGAPITGLFHVDHIIPLSRGGEHSYANAQPAHPVCNSRKSARLPHEVQYLRAA